MPQGEPQATPTDPPHGGAGHDLAGRLLAWYEREGRVLPWRMPPASRSESGAAAKPDPYAVWLSEVMLQQTTVKAVLPRYRAFLRRWPTVAALAAAPLDDVLGEWAGLGYYARARNLHACAREVAQRHGGRFPDDEAALRALPGIGAYTAAAIAAIAFGRHATPVDGNIERVMARLFAVKTPLPQAKPEIKALAETLTPEGRAGDFAQSLMDLGATICTPKNPLCGLCPLRPDCAGCAEAIAEQLPIKEPKSARPIRRGVAFLLLRDDGAVLLRQRPPRGLLGGMLEVPSSPWTETPLTPSAEEAALRQAPAEAAREAAREEMWQRLPGLVEHTFTHFHLELAVYRATIARSALKPDPESDGDGQGCWIAFGDLAKAALPSVMRKVLVHGGLELRPRRPESL